MNKIDKINKPDGIQGIRPVNLSANLFGSPQPARNKLIPVWDQIVIHDADMYKVEQ